MGSTRQILRPVPPLNGLFYCALRSLPCNEFRLGGFVRATENTRERCTRFIISEFASLVRKFYSRGRAPSVRSYW